MSKCCYNCDSKDDSKAMYSVDYDSLIENLTHTRDEIDSLINILKARQNKDNTINKILSSEYEEEKDDDEKSIEELKKLVEDMLENPKRYRPREDTDLFRVHTYPKYPWSLYTYF